MKNRLDHIIKQAIGNLCRCESCTGDGEVSQGLAMVGQQSVVSVLEELISILFPGCHQSCGTLCNRRESTLREVSDKLCEQCRRTFEHQCRIEKCPDKCNDCGELAEDAVLKLIESLPEIMDVLQEDIVAAYEGDPAAKSTLEVVMSYPGVYAVIVHRIAHKLYELRVPLIPRVMSEHAHSKTGIDIHPGATIGAGFFIDHGTGVVIGETCRIGKRVKIYQGVTLGAISFEKDADGNIIKGTQRHPQVEDRVVIYAGATILGGKTIIGAESEIGGNVWLTHSVPPRSKVYNQQPRPLIRAADGSWHRPDGKVWDDFGAGI